MSKCELLVVGELMSYKDAETGRAFSDGNGKFLKAMLRNAGIDPRAVSYTNVFKCTAPRGSIYSLCGPKDKGIPHMRYIKRGKYVKAEYASHLQNLWKKVNELQPNLVLACGEAAMWALTSSSDLEKSRGYITPGNSAIPNTKVLPTYHPRDIQRSRANMPYWYADLTKAEREMKFPELRRPSHELWLEPTLNDMEEFYQLHLRDAEEISVDIENNPQFITCVGFAPNPDIGIVVPFYDSRKPGNSYWPTAAEEVLAWKWVKRMLSFGPTTYGQNFTYDMQYLWRQMGIPCPTADDDTMLMQHAAQPELRKSLGVLASIYTDEVAWKGMRTETLKKED